MVLNINQTIQEIECIEVKGKKISLVESDMILEKFLAREHQVQIFVNERLVFQVVCSPNEVLELAIGRLLTEGLIYSCEDIDTVYVCDTGNKVKVYLKEGKNISLLTESVEVSSCCTDNKSYMFEKQRLVMKQLERIDWKQEDIYTMSAMMNAELPLYEATHAVHSAMLFYDGKILYRSEDIGRHNALDKVIGHALLEGIDLGKCIVFSSGRVPVDMAKKVIRAGIPVFAAKGAPTYDAVMLARQYGLTLLANVRGDSMVAYTE